MALPFRNRCMIERCSCDDDRLSGFAYAFAWFGKVEIVAGQLKVDDRRLTFLNSKARHPSDPGGPTNSRIGPHAASPTQGSHNPCGASSTRGASLDDATRPHGRWETPQRPRDLIVACAPLPCLGSNGGARHRQLQRRVGRPTSLISSSLDWTVVLRGYAR